MNRWVDFLKCLKHLIPATPRSDHDHTRIRKQSRRLRMAMSIIGWWRWLVRWASGGGSFGGTAPMYAADEQASRPFVWFPLSGQRHAIDRPDRQVPAGEPMRCLCGAIHPRGTEGIWNGFGKPASAVGRRRVGLWRFVGVDDLSEFGYPRRSVPSRTTSCPSSLNSPLYSRSRLAQRTAQ